MLKVIERGRRERSFCCWTRSRARGARLIEALRAEAAG
jgi:hypothetical protein